MSALYHYCCRHSAKLIVRSGALRPFPQPLLRGLPVLWATDQETPDREALGLTMHMVQCDRTERRFTIPDYSTQLFTPWLDSPVRLLVDDLANFEAAPRDPTLWWVSILPVVWR